MDHANCGNFSGKEHSHVSVWVLCFCISVAPARCSSWRESKGWRPYDDAVFHIAIIFYKRIKKGLAICFWKLLVVVWLIACQLSIFF